MTTLVQSKYAKREIPTANPTAYGQVAAMRFYYDFTVAGAATQIVELGILPANCIPVDATFMMSGTYTGRTFDCGIMSGLGGDLDSASATSRTCGDELFDGAALDDADGHLRSLNVDLATITPVEYDRGIGFIPDGAIAASSAKKIWLWMLYMNVLKGQP